MTAFVEVEVADGTRPASLCWECSDTVEAAAEVVPGLGGWRGRAADGSLAATAMMCVMCGCNRCYCILYSKVERGDDGIEYSLTEIEGNGSRAGAAATSGRRTAYKRRALKIAVLGLMSVGQCSLTFKFVDLCGLYCGENST